MRVVVPLAGPDFVLADGRTKAEQIVEGRPLLRAALDSRPWASLTAARDYSFVLLDRPETRAFATDCLAVWYPEAHVVFMSRPTRGAALSALGGLTGYAVADDTLVIDLADILYTCDQDPVEVLRAAPENGALALTFDSADPSYSYLRTDAAGMFVEAAEKRVISRNASAGTYLFAGTSIYLRALAHSIDHEDVQIFNGLHYVCPLMNGVRDQGKGVRLLPVGDVRDVKVSPSA